jgi:hypothetical protein
MAKTKSAPETEKEIAPKRRRTATGKAKSSTERIASMEAALQASGGRVLGTLRLSAEAAAALEVLTERYGTVRMAIEQALIKAKK